MRRILRRDRLVRRSSLLSRRSESVVAEGTKNVALDLRYLVAALFLS